jgi:hypothetical protein
MQSAPSIRTGWKIMLAMGIYLAALGLFLVAAPQVGFEKAFAAFTGNSWTNFASANAEPSELFLIMQKYVGANVLSAAVLVIGITLTSYRKGARWSWYTLLVGGIIGWGSCLTFHATIGIRETLMGGLISIIGTIIFIVAIALPAKAILVKKAAGK